MASRGPPDPQVYSRYLRGMPEDRASRKRSGHGFKTSCVTATVKAASVGSPIEPAGAKQRRVPFRYQIKFSPASAGFFFAHGASDWHCDRGRRCAPDVWLWNDLSKYIL